MKLQKRQHVLSLLKMQSLGMHTGLASCIPSPLSAAHGRRGTQPSPPGPWQEDDLLTGIECRLAAVPTPPFIARLFDRGGSQLQVQ